VGGGGKGVRKSSFLNARRRKGRSATTRKSGSSDSASRSPLHGGGRKSMQDKRILQERKKEVREKKKTIIPSEKRSGLSVSKVSAVTRQSSHRQEPRVDGAREGDPSIEQRGKGKRRQDNSTVTSPTGLVTLTYDATGLFKQVKQ